MMSWRLKWSTQDALMTRFEGKRCLALIDRDAKSMHWSGCGMPCYLNSYRGNCESKGAASGKVNVVSGITESVVEEACLEWFRSLGFSTAYGPDIGPDGPSEERSSWEDMILVARLRSSIVRINPGLSHLSVDQVIATVLRAESQNALAENLRLHRLMTGGVPVEVREADGSIRNVLAWLVDFEHPERNDWMAATSLPSLSRAGIADRT